MLVDGNNINGGEKMMKEFMSRVDEVIGAGMLSGIAIYGMTQGCVEIAQACVAGIIALLAVSAVNGGK